MKHNSDFRYDLQLGILGEGLVANIFTEKKLEVKTDYKAVKTGNVFVEYFSRDKPSGISTSIADFYVFVLSNENVIFISAGKLKEKCRKYLNGKRDVLGGDNNTSKGILLPINDLVI